MNKKKCIKKFVLTFCFILFFLNIGFGQQYTRRTQGDRSDIIAVSGLLKDDLALLEFFEKYPVWEQVTRENSITLEFIGFEKENTTTDPFKFGKAPNSEPNPIVGSVFAAPLDNYRAVKIYFLENGSVLESTVNLVTPGVPISNEKSHESADKIIGYYRYSGKDGKVYLDLISYGKRELTLIKGEGKSLGLSGGPVENLFLEDSESGLVYKKQSQGDNKEPEDLSWMLPENRFLVKFTLRYNGYETVNGITSIKKNKVEERFAFIKSFTVTERDVKVKYGTDIRLSEQQASGIIKDDNIPWRTVVIQLVSGIDPKLFSPGSVLGPGSTIGLSTLELINWGQNTNPNEKFKNNSSNFRLITGKSLWPFGWESSKKIFLPENHYLSPAINGGSSNSSTFGTEVDANCIMTFMPVVNTAGGVNLSDVIVFDSYKLEGNSLLTFDKLGFKSYKFEVISQKIFGIGKEKSRKGTYSVSPTSQTITFKFDDGAEKTFLVTKIREGYMTEFKDSSGAVFSLNKVQNN